MKRAGNLWPQVVAFENLLRAARAAQKGKRFRGNVLEFNFNLERELERLQQELLLHSYQPGGYHNFEIYEPKRRVISAAPYRDRVVHHALCSVIEPVFDPGFIYDSYANRRGKGSHKALYRFVQFSRSSRYVLKCDVVKYFPSMDHLILKSVIRRKIKCRDTLWLIDRIVDNSNGIGSQPVYFPGDTLFTPIERSIGIPIGNLTSQFFANIYLDPFDHWIKDQLGIKKYVRYVDDFAVFSDDRDYLEDLKSRIPVKLQEYRLHVHPVKSRITAIADGENFLGFRVFPDRIRVRNGNLRRARNRLRRLRGEYQTGTKSIAEIGDSLRSWFAHLNDKIGQAGDQTGASWR
jgi:RNA-directed DNA polymerase